MTSLKFGTSGLRGLVTELVGWPAFSYTLAFCRLLQGSGGLPASVKVLIGRDLRDSSPEIAARCGSAIRAAGLVPLDCGALPTPALALHGLYTGSPAVMVTGSHIPEDRNGLKFYRADGEIEKNDEVAILRLHAGLNPETVTRCDAGMQPGGEVPFERYRNRYLQFFGPSSLSGLTVGIYQHSSVARDLLVEVIGELGATAVPLGRSDSFIPVDTEALRPEDVALGQSWAASRPLDAIVSTDGDADRPLIADERGVFLRGDLVGTMTAARLGADTVITPVTSNSAIEYSRRFARVERTRVGSPYVIAGMSAARSQGGGVIVGFEANGGVLLGSDAEIDGRTLVALPTRDALLPILCVLGEIARLKRPLSQIALDYAFNAAAADRLQHVTAEASAEFLQRLGTDADYRAAAFKALGGLSGFDDRDGVRLTTGRGETVHFRASGNAPELRCYVEAASDSRATKLLAWGLALARSETARM